MHIGSPGSMSLIEGRSHSISRSKVAEDGKADPKGESLGVLPEPRSAPTNIIGKVESTSDGRLGVIVSATVVGRAPPSGLILQVQVKPTDGRGAETGDDVADRVRQGLSPQDGPGLAFGVRQQEEMAPAERAEVQEMQGRDASVRREEQAHAAAAGSMAGAIQYEYATAPMADVMWSTAPFPSKASRFLAIRRKWNAKANAWPQPRCPPKRRPPPITPPLPMAIARPVRPAK